MNASQIKNSLTEELKWWKNTRACWKSAVPPESRREPLLGALVHHMTMAGTFANSRRKTMPIWSSSAPEEWVHSQRIYWVCSGWVQCPVSSRTTQRFPISSSINIKKSNLAIDCNQWEDIACTIRKSYEFFKYNIHKVVVFKHQIGMQKRDEANPRVMALSRCPSFHPKYQQHQSYCRYQRLHQYSTRTTFPNEIIFFKKYVIRKSNQQSKNTNT